MFQTDFKQTISDKIIQDEPLSRHTTIGIGGPAKYFYSCDSIDQLKSILLLCQKYQLTPFILGAGSNIIISDKGIDTLVLKLAFQNLEIINNENTTSTSHLHTNPIHARHSVLKQNSYNTDLANSFSESDQLIQIKVSSSWKLIPLMIELHKQGITGLEWFSGIPGTIGGAIYMNIHGGPYFFSDFLNSVEVMNKNGEIKTHTLQDLNLDYDHSYFHENKDIILNATLSLYKGNINNAKNIIKNWGVAKTLNQPQRSAGCIWQNLDQKTQEKLNLPTPSIGYIIDKILNLKNTQKGDAIIAAKHAGFIENLGQANFNDALYLIELVESEFKKKFGLSLTREIEIIN